MHSDDRLWHVVEHVYIYPYSMCIEMYVRCPSYTLILGECCFSWGVGNINIQLLPVALPVFLEYVSFNWHCACYVRKHIQWWLSNEWDITVHRNSAILPGQAMVAQPQTHIVENPWSKNRVWEFENRFFFIQGTPWHHFSAAPGNGFSWPTDEANPCFKQLFQRPGPKSWTFQTTVEGLPNV